MEENIILIEIEKKVKELIELLELNKITEIEIFSIFRKSSFYNDFYLNYFIELFFIELIKSNSSIKPKSLIKNLFENLDPEFQLYPDIISSFNTRIKIIEKYNLKNTKIEYGILLNNLKNFNGNLIDENILLNNYKEKILLALNKDLN